MDKFVKIIGGGLAGCEAAWQAAQRGVKVKLYEMKPLVFSPAHKSADLCELVCSNSFKSTDITNASGLLKEEMRVCGSLILKCADESAVGAGGALAVDRVKFSRAVTEQIKNHPNIEVISEEIKEIDDGENVEIIATGPLTSEALCDAIGRETGGFLHFYDAAAPVIFAESVDTDKAFYASRYGKGDADYLNCPMNRQEYEAFYKALVTAECADVKDFDELNLYEGCMPVESIAKRGEQTLCFGPLKPVGITNPKTGETYYAVVQLRKENEEGTLFNMVGFQTRLKFGEQKRVFGMIPGLENAEFARYGVMHKNTYINSPGLLDRTYRVKGKNLYFAGQITGVEGYIESASSGLVAGINAAKLVKGEPEFIFPDYTAIGALAKYASSYAGEDFQPMGANYGIISQDPDCPVTKKTVRDKAKRRIIQSENSLEKLKKITEGENYK